VFEPVFISKCWYKSQAYSIFELMFGVEVSNHIAFCLFKTFKVGMQPDFEETGANAMGKVDEYPIKPIHGFSGVNWKRIIYSFTPTSPNTVWILVFVPT
jgi:hypothetical protein